MRLNVQQVWDLPTARCRFGKYLRVEVNGSVPPVAEVLRDHPSRRVETEEGSVTQGLPVRLVLHREGASGNWTSVTRGGSIRRMRRSSAGSRAATASPRSSTTGLKERLSPRRMLG